MRIAGIYKQLKERRVIRAAVIYVALLWAVLQAAGIGDASEIICQKGIILLIPDTLTMQ